MESSIQTKDRILWACERINKASQGALQILRDSTIANIRAIERNSRSIKDPNPLMSTMTNINVKYPITFKKDRINLEIVPFELFCNTQDNRRSGRILCKTEMIQWYLENVGENNEKIASVVQLFESSKKKFDKVFNYPWESVKFKIGNVSLSRALVPVNPNDIDIPKEFIKPAILQTLCLNNMIEYVDVPEYYLEQVRKILQNSNLDIRSLPNILNYIVSQMDKRFRYLPILRGLSPDFIYISHALLQPQYRAATLLSEASHERGQNKSITDLCINLIFYCRMNNCPYYQIKEFINTFTFHEYPVQKIMYSTDENKFTRFVKGCIGIEIIPVIEKPSIKFYPKHCDLFESIHYNKNRLEFRRYNGEEVVFFESSTSKGFFVHNADSLLTITINRTSLKNMAFTLGQIAVFITKGFDFSNAPTMKSMRAQIAKKFTEKWWLVVGLEERSIRNVKREIEGGRGDVTMGALRFSDSVEIEYPDSEKCIVKDDVLIGAKSGQPICLAPFVAEPVILDFNLKTNDSRLYSILNPKRMLIKAVQYTLNFLGQIKKNIRLDQFTSPFYVPLSRYVPISMQEKISEYLKDLLKSKLISPGRNDLFIAVFYNFTYGGAKKTTVLSIEKINFARETISFDLSEGIITISPEGNLLCDDEVVVSISNNVNVENESVCAILPGYTMKRIYKVERGFDTHSISWLNNNFEKVPEGYKAYTIFQTAIFEVKKTSISKIQTLKTLKRHIKVGIEEDTSNEFSKYLLKRKAEEGLGSSTDSSGEKRRKVEYASSIIS